MIYKFINKIIFTKIFWILFTIIKHIFCFLRIKTPGVCIVPTEPVGSACACPVGSVAANQHEVVGVGLDEPHVVGLVRGVGLVVEPTHGVQVHVGDPPPEVKHSLSWMDHTNTSNVHYDSLQIRKVSFRHLKPSLQFHRNGASGSTSYARCRARSLKTPKKL